MIPTAFVAASCMRAEASAAKTPETEHIIPIKSFIDPPRRSRRLRAIRSVQYIYCLLSCRNRIHPGQCFGLGCNGFGLFPRRVHVSLLSGVRVAFLVTWPCEGRNRS